MSSMQTIKAEIWTEGPTDVLHLKKAFEVLDFSENIIFKENQKEQGDSALLKKCEIFSEKFQTSPMIFIFDRDNNNTIKHVTDKEGNYKVWGNNVFSFAIPIPTHRKGYENVCIEFYYSDDELQTKDALGRRIFLTSEFNNKSGKLKCDSSIHISNISKLRGFSDIKKAKIISSDVFNGNSQNIALSKIQFAKYILDEQKPFNGLNFDKFKKILAIIQTIIETTKETFVREKKIVDITNFYQNKKEQKNSISPDKNRRSIEQFFFELNKDVQGIIRKLCIANLLFPPIEINSDLNIQTKTLSLATSFPVSKKHNLKKPLSIVLRMSLIELKKRSVRVDHSVVPKKTETECLPELEYHNIFNGKYDPIRLKEIIEKLFTLIFQEINKNSEIDFAINLLKNE